MRYYVVTDDGQKYGPADVQTLNSWIAESRLLPHQMLEEEASGARFAARSVPGLNFPVPVTPTQAPGPGAGPGAGPGPGQPGPGQPGYAGYYRPPGGAVGDDGSRDITPAWVLFAVGLVSCCFVPYITLVISGAGVFFANKAKQKGHPQGAVAFGLNVGVLILAILMTILVVGFRSYFMNLANQGR